MRDFFIKIRKTISFDWYFLCLFVLVSFSFPAYYQKTFYLLVALSAIQFYRVFTSKIALDKTFQGFFYLLIYSLIFFRSIHTLFLILCVLLGIYAIFKLKKLQTKIYFKQEIVVLILFGIVFINHLIFSQKLDGLDTYLYLLFYPILFFTIKKAEISISKNSAMRVFISSVFVASFLLIILNLFHNNLSIQTNTFFSKYLGIIHVYFGMFLGVACCFLISFYEQKKVYINKLATILVFLFFVALLIHIGARMSLLAVLLMVVLLAYKKLDLKSYLKVPILALTFVGLIVIGYQSIPRFRSGIENAQKAYLSVKNNDKKDLIANSWQNMYQRLLVTQYTLQEIKAHFLLGIGIQNTRGVLGKKIHKDGYQYFESINPHNQYLHILLGMGIFAFLYFLFMLRSFFYQPFYNLYFFYFFLLIMCTESILVRVKGISLFFLFSLVFSLKEKLKHD